jgi:hypothetical protein
MHYRHKQHPVQVIQWTGDNLAEVVKFTSIRAGYNATILIRNGDNLTLSSDLWPDDIEADLNDYIVREEGTYITYNSTEFEALFEQISAAEAFTPPSREHA